MHTSEKKSKNSKKLHNQTNYRKDLKSTKKLIYKYFYSLILVKWFSIFLVLKPQKDKY